MQNQLNVPVTKTKLLILCTLILQSSKPKASNIQIFSVHLFCLETHSVDGGFPVSLHPSSAVVLWNWISILSFSSLGQVIFCSMKQILNILLFFTFLSFPALLE